VERHSLMAWAAQHDALDREFGYEVAAAAV
jgi:hypothetical protein